MPKFIYTIIVITILNILVIYLVITQTSPTILTNKIIFSFLIAFLISFLIPLILTILKLVKNPKEDLNQYFKKTFKNFLLISVLSGFLIFLRIQLMLEYYHLFIILFFIFLGKYFLFTPRKPIKKSKY